MTYRYRNVTHEATWGGKACTRDGTNSSLEEESCNEHDCDRDCKLSEEMNSGTLDEKGPVVMQLNKLLKSRDGVEAPVPQYLPTVEPWYRYQEFEAAIRKNYAGRKLFENIHPTTVREMAIYKKNERFVDKGMYLRNTVTRPTAAMLTWSKRFECSAFWCDGSMKLLQIDGMAAPGAAKIIDEDNKPAATPGNADATASVVHDNWTVVGEKEKENTREENKTKSDEHPRMDSAEVQAIAKRKSENLRDNIVAAIMSPPPPGIRREDRSDVEALLSKARQRLNIVDDAKVRIVDDDAHSVGSSRSKQSSFVAQPVSAEASLLDGYAGVTGQKYLSTMPEFDKKLYSEDPMREVRLLAIRCEREVCEARLEVAQTEVAKVEAEEAVLRAKKACAKKEAEALRKLLGAYADAESKLASMAV